MVCNVLQGNGQGARGLQGVKGIQNNYSGQPSAETEGEDSSAGGVRESLLVLETGYVYVYMRNIFCIMNKKGGIVTRLNITIPDHIADGLSRIPNKSKFIAEVLEKELKERKQRELDRLLVEGYQKTKAEDASLDAEWEEATLETWSAS